MAYSEIMKNNIQNFLTNMENESNIEEDIILQEIKPNIKNLLRKKYQEYVLNAIHSDIQNNNVPNQLITSPEMMNKYFQNLLLKIEQDSNNQEDTILQKINPNIQNLVRRKMKNLISNQIHNNF